VDYYDMPVVREIANQAAEDDYRFVTLIAAVVRSAPFRMNVKAAADDAFTAAAVE
jgi:hypothetical protein